MDLLQTVRKEGSRGGRNEFSWSDVQSDPHRQNYLGHSLMAPVGRWQKNKDLNWYAKGENNGDEEANEAAQRKAELQKVKQQEEDEMLRAMGLPVPDRENANLEPVVLRAGLGGQEKGAGETDKRERSRSRERRHRRHDSRERRHRRRSRSRDGDDHRRYARHRDGRDGRRDEDARRRHHNRRERSRSRSGERKRYRSRSPRERRERDRDGDRRRRHD